jgi:hypothetical protein
LAVVLLGITVVAGTLPLSHRVAGVGGLDTNIRHAAFEPGLRAEEPVAQ